MKIRSNKFNYITKHTSPSNYYNSIPPENIAKLKQPEDKLTLKQLGYDVVMGSSLGLALLASLLVVKPPQHANSNSAPKRNTAVESNLGKEQEFLDITKSSSGLTKESKDLIKNITSYSVDSDASDQFEKTDISAQDTSNAVPEIDPEVVILKNNARMEGKYYVAKGETLWRISQKFQAQTEQFKLFTNHLTDQINIGQLIENVPSFEASEDTTLAELADKAGMPLEELAKLNGLEEDSVINKGEKVYVYISSAQNTPAVTPTPKPTNEEKIEETVLTDDSVILSDGTVKSAEELYDNAVSTAPKGMPRPRPIIDENGNIKADVKVYNSSISNGVLSGKTILVNAGHGGYNPNNGYFDPGTYGKDENGNVIEEWYINNIMATKLRDELLAKGANVIFTSGSVYNVTAPIKEYADSVDASISIHLNYAEDTSVSGYRIYTKPDDLQESNTLAEAIQSQLDVESPELHHEDYAVLRVNNSNPGVLIEAGFMSSQKDMSEVTDNFLLSSRVDEIAQGVCNIFN